MPFKSFCFIVVLIFSVSSVQVSTVEADGGLLDFLFPTTSNEPNPAKTLRAPFADGDAVIEEMDASGNSANITPLHLRHRTNIVMTRWVQQNIPNMLSYKSDVYKTQYEEKIINFSKIGSGEYLKFLQEKNFLKTLETGRYDVAGFIRDYPIILNEGAVDGRYRWLYQINVMVTYIQRGATDYTNIDDSDVISQEFIVTFQLGRSKDAGNEHAMLIETWHAKPKKK